MLFCLFFTSNYSIKANAFTINSEWFQEALFKADTLNDKNPLLALEYVRDLLDKHKDSLSPLSESALLARLAEYHFYLGDLEKSLNHINQFYRLKTDLTNHDGISLLLTHGGVLDELGKPKEAMALYLQAEKNAKESENDVLVGETYAVIANSYLYNHDDSEALKYFHQAYLHIEALDDKLELAYLKIQMSHAYSNVYDYERAISLANEAIEYLNQHQYFFDEVSAHNTLAHTYMKMNAYDDAIESYQRIVELSSVVEGHAIHVAYSGMAKSYLWKGEDVKAQHYFALYKEKRPNSDNPFRKLDDIVLTALIAFSEKDIPLTHSYLQQADDLLATIDKKKVLSWYAKVLNLKAEIAVFNNDYQSAYQYQKDAHELVSSYQNTEREVIRSKYKIMFDTDQALLKNQLLERDKLLDKAALENAEQKQELQTLFIILVSLFALSLTFFIYRQSRTSKVLHKLANTDTLTELANRRYTFSYAEKILEQAKNEQHNFAIIAFDIDHFKKVNDTYGHTTGDIVLKKIATIGNEYVRANDILGRIGGEEFLVVLPNTSATQAYEIAERIRKAIENKPIVVDKHTINISASFGIAELSSSKITFNQLFNQADIALYQAKDNGRNCIIVAS
ncbi:diguanylate cyclase [Colwellia sp. D2M02]|uniref:tetratricopeptide repeat-containing diguanylate cyclase n=1 Tax=Colwellia sp. D2M02 TaxID=2841562 RepID=UPI001C0948AB|nr:diguanylate cyclase [Colwellia sp. D2M02]